MRNFACKANKPSQEINVTAVTAEGGTTYYKLGYALARMAVL